MMLYVEGLVAGYPSGGRILDGVSFDLKEGEVVALLGRNGMGKTTLMRALCGQLPLQAGTIRCGGQSLGGQPTFQFARAGIGYVPQGREIFANFTVEENLMLGALGKPSLPRSLPAETFEIFPILGERRAQRAGTLSGGQQQQLAIMRALVGQPRLLLLDEPSEGIQPSIVDEIAVTLGRIARERGLTVLIVEQNLDFVEQLASRILFMENGRIAARQAEVGELRSDSDLIHRFLSI
ncbi:ABC transporter ATP-binding protein [Methylobacterium symbioticum]|uniref:High-affinity branched-chain amino acid transport ATP-binding protein LivF n=1 Tax=Methylobacterium symbioticum TaxID=2584084 RepID=A0A509E746_9HYPH|nr:ATP-binding cassette domain-containing protein [Methylobacterium symbioticum]VUD70001.1 High-affinity branched-chain amino acid transport ATP-binding protein LivF [Methylobacterium symbioticum]